MIKILKGHTHEINKIQFDLHGRFLASCANDETIRLWNVQDGTQVRAINILDCGSKDVGTIIAALSLDNKIIVLNLYDGILGEWNLKEGEGFKRIGGPPEINHITYSPNENIVASSDVGGNIILWNSDGKLIKILKGHTSAVTSLSFTPDGKILASASSDGTVRLWNIQSGENVALVSKGDEWIMFTPDGYFDSSRNGGKFLAMVNKLTAFGIDQFAIKNNRPDLILERIGLGDEKLISHFYLQYKKRLKKLGLSEEQLSQDLHVPVSKIASFKQDDKFVDINLNLMDTKYNLKRYNIYVNGVPEFGHYGKEINGKFLNKTEKIELTRGKNRIEVSATNEVGVESNREFVNVEYNQGVKEDLYYIGFGVSKYKDNKLNLTYADKDAVDLGNAFSNMKYHFDNVYTHTYLNDEVTIENIKKAKELLKNARVDDTFVLFISGHGVYKKSDEAKYYYLTHNADLKNLSKTAADFEIFEELLQDIKPRKKLFLMDTCESGEIDDEKKEQYFAMANSKGILPRTVRNIDFEKRDPDKRAYLYDKDRFIYSDLLRKSGTIVFSSSKGEEFSYESDAIKNGFFTSNIVNTLVADVADTDKDGKISTSELVEYVSQTVSQQTWDMQHPTVDRDNIYQKFGFPIVSGSFSKTNVKKQPPVSQSELSVKASMRMLDSEPLADKVIKKAAEFELIKISELYYLSPPGIKLYPPPNLTMRYSSEISSTIDVKMYAYDVITEEFFPVKDQIIDRQKRVIKAKIYESGCVYGLFGNYPDIR